MSDPVPSDMPLPWRNWFAGLDDEQKTAVASAWEATASDGDIQERHANSRYARKAALIERCGALGYAP